ncbi:MAG: energy transducer TonB [Prevotellaceae bacterium]|jgi:TonB family protein|nr:energy transducer TonB [Prevotellaceae bacterium]
MKKLYLFCLITALLTACSGNQPAATGFWKDKPIVAKRVTVGTDTVTVYNPDQVTDTVNMPLSEIITDLDVVRLDDMSRDAFIGTEALITVSEKYIGVYNQTSHRYQLYNREGTYLQDVSARGQGPYEFAMAIYDSYIDDAGMVYLMPWMDKKLIAYDIQKDQYRAIPLTYQTTKAYFKVDTAKQQITVLNLPFAPTSIAVWVQDFEGNLIQELPAGHFSTPSPDYSNELISNFSTDATDVSLFTVTEEPVVDSLYHYDATENRLAPVFSLYPQKKGFNYRPWFIELPDYYLAKFYKPNEPYKTVLVNKENLRGFYANFQLDMLGGLLSTNSPAFMRGYYIDNREPMWLKEDLETILATETIDDALRTRLEGLAKSLNDNSNNVLLIGKLRQKGEAAFEGDVEFYETKGQKSPAKAQTTQPNNKPDKADTEESETDIAFITPWLNKEAIEYFRTNNRYKDWDSADKKTAYMRCVVEQDGTVSKAELLKGTGNEDLDKEAVRLMQGIPKVTPGRDKNNQPIRVQNMIFYVHFPPIYDD